jgi:ankyrin repeat protein
MNNTLFYASFKGNVKELRKSVNEGHTIHVTDRTGTSALMYAARCGDIEMVKFLLEAGAIVNQSNHYSQRPIHFAIERGNIAIVSLLLSKQARTDVRDEWGNTPFNIAVIKGAVDIVELLYNEKVVNVPNDRKETPLDNSIDMRRVTTMYEAEHDAINLFLVKRNAQSLSPIVPRYHEQRMKELEVLRLIQ